MSDEMNEETTEVTEKETVETEADYKDTSSKIQIRFRWISCLISKVIN